MYPAQRENWNIGIKKGSSPEALIDYAYFKAFSLKYKELLKPDFGKEINKLATRLETITDVRNKIAHYNKISEDEYAEAFINLKSIARSIKMEELELAFQQLQQQPAHASNQAESESAQTPKVSGTYHGKLPWFKVVIPHLDIKMGRLDESVFAANLAEVALGNGREMYTNPAVFFSKTYFTAGLKNIARRMVQGLNGGQDADNRVISLQTGFGGGKTHTLIFLFHLARMGKKALRGEYTIELLATMGAPDFDSAHVAVFTNTTNDPAQGRQAEDINIKTLWDELAFQLGGKKAYEIIRINDEKRTAPKGLFKKVLETCKPALILIDELADYCVSASAQKVEASTLGDQTVSFMQELTEAVSGTDNCVLIATLPASAQELGKHRVTQGVVVTTLLGTFGAKGQNKGVSTDELKLCMVKPEGFNPNDINTAIDKLEDNAHYLYYSSTGQKRYWFDTTPNINILVNQAKSDIGKESIFAEIIKRIKDKTKNLNVFGTAVVDPLDEIPEQTKPALLILSPKYLAGLNEINGKTKPFIEKIATKKGNSERIYRNTLLFLICSEIGIGKLQEDVRNYLVCQKISSEYSTQLSAEQKVDIRKRIDEADKQSNTALVSAYSIIAKHTVKNGVDCLLVKHFKDSLDNQINTYIIDALKEEEWLLESVGLGTLKSNNLLPTIEQSIKAKDVYEAFLRFDDKPMITGQQAISTSLLRYCNSGKFCIATGDGKKFTRFYFQESVSFFEITDSTYWLVDKSMKPQSAADVSITDENTAPGSSPSAIINGSGLASSLNGTTSVQLTSITISGKVPLENYTELFNYFITPFAMSGNKIDIEVKFKIRANEGSPIDESRQQYKTAKEASKQLGLRFEEE